MSAQWVVFMIAIHLVYVISDGKILRIYFHNCACGVADLKNAPVEPDSTQPYLILVCLARSSADSIGDAMRSTVKKAARLAV